MKYIVYKSEDRCFVMTESDEPRFLKNVVTQWDYDLTAEFERLEIHDIDACVEIEMRQGFTVS